MESKEVHILTSI